MKSFPYITIIRHIDRCFYRVQFSPTFHIEIPLSDIDAYDAIETCATYLRSVINQPKRDTADEPRQKNALPPQEQSQPASLRPS